MSRLVLAAGLPAVLALTACYKIDYTTGRNVSGSADEEIMHHRVLWGIVELEGEVEMQEICNGGHFTKIHTEVDVISALAGWGTALGMSVVTVGTLGWVVPYAPSNVHIWCRNGTAYRATVGQDGLVLGLEAPLDQELPVELGVFSDECASE